MNDDPMKYSEVLDMALDDIGRLQSELTQLRAELRQSREEYQHEAVMRESENAQLRAECGELRKLQEAVKGSAGLKCPELSCGDTGCITGTYYDRRGDLQPEPMQCEFCYTVPDSVFNRESALSQQKAGRRLA